MERRKSHRKKVHVSSLFPSLFPLALFTFSIISVLYPFSSLFPPKPVKMEAKITNTEAYSSRIMPLMSSSADAPEDETKHSFMGVSF